jgi:hypothetical protein
VLLSALHVPLSAHQRQQHCTMAMLGHLQLPVVQSRRQSVTRLLSLVRMAELATQQQQQHQQQQQQQQRRQQRQQR